MRTCALLLAVTVAPAAFGGAQAARRRSFWRPLWQPLPTPPAIAATCQAAHDADKRANVTFCMNIFGLLRPHDSTVRGLAQAAASMGAGRADTAQTTIDRTLRQGGVDDPRARRALERCDRLYGSAAAAFKAARKAITEGRYADVGRALEGVSELGRQCDSENPPASSGNLAPLWIFSGANEQLTYLTIAITSLIK
ncbi:hypothetical protein VPH35_079906 [Triticum aestivum]|uniref:Pectinesterase inhibitor domain-containing protein n=1 Tax=Aegilops tauschii TaxID=37682 RepID=M8B7D0_AEGTA